MGIINVSRIDPENIGDMNNAPINYFNFLKNVERICPTHENLADKINDKIILVVGGMVSCKYFDKAMEIINKSKHKKLIGWSLGHNLHGGTKIKMPEYLQKYDLISVRDYGYKYEWVPCSSCMHSLFDKKYKIKHKIVVYEHHLFGKLPIEGFPKLSNKEKSLKKVIKFLGSGEIVLTSTYHGAYWATLLNKKVIIINPFSSKFYGLKHKHPITDIANWKSKIKDTVNYPNALAECREANLKFAKKVKDLTDLY